MRSTDTPFTPIDPTSNNEWVLEVARNGTIERIKDFDWARLLNERRDFDFICTQSEDGNFVSVRRRGGGGAVTALYAMNEELGELWLGGVIQLRRNIADTPIFNLMRGYNQPGEDNLSAALREAIEESGRTDLLKPIKLKGATLNVDSAMNDSVHGGGVDLHMVRVPIEALVYQEDPDFEEVMVFNTSDLTEEQRKENIYKVIFIPGELSVVARLADAFTIAGFARLLADLQEAGIM